MSVILVRVHTDKSVISEVSEFGTLSLIFSYIILFNVILSYGLETSFFRFYNTEKNKKIRPFYKLVTYMQVNGWRNFNEQSLTCQPKLIVRQ